MGDMGLSYEMYKIRVGVDVIAKSRTDAENLVCNILDHAFIYGVGKYEATVMDKQYRPVDVTRVFDYDIEGEHKEHHDCLNCSASMSDDDEDSNMILRCAEHDWKVVSPDGYCDEWN